jgi:hypothetical protein
MAVSGAPTTITDADGRVVAVGQGRSVTGRVTAVNATTGVITLLLVEPYATLDSQRTSITVPAYSLRGGVFTSP